MVAEISTRTEVPSQGVTIYYNKYANRYDIERCARIPK